MEHQTVEISCPQCHVRLSVTNSKNEAIKRIKCPNCGKQIDIRFKRPVREDGATVLGGIPTGGETQLGPVSVSRKKAYLEFNGVRYNLEIGRNTIGRKAKTSNADVQLDTSDLYMSRQHAIINVRRMPDGSIKSDIANDKNKNATLVNGIEIMPNDILVLQDGATIKMGHTTVTFHYSEN